MSLVFKLLSSLPLWLLHAVGVVLGWLVFVASPSYRRRFLANARQAGYGFGQVHQAVAHAGRMTCELPRIWFGAPVPVQWINADLIEHAQQKRQGLLFLTPHLGCFEMTAQAVQQRFGAQIGQLTVLYRPSRQPTLTPLMAQARQRQGLALAPTNLSGVRILLKALRLGQAVGLLPDQVPPEGMGQWTPFFGHNAYTMTLAARLALQTGATIILVWCERLTWGRGYVMRVASLNAPLSGDLGVAVLQINQAMEQLIRQAPQQYLWGYGRYKQPRREL